MRFLDSETNSAFGVTYHVVKNGTAPQPLNIRGRRSPWRDRFEKMQPLEWFVVPYADRYKTQAAAASYLKGRYSFYKINSNGDFCLLKLR